MFSHISFTWIVIEIGQQLIENPEIKNIISLQYTTRIFNSVLKSFATSTSQTLCSVSSSNFSALTLAQ